MTSTLLFKKITTSILFNNNKKQQQQQPLLDYIFVLSKYTTHLVPIYFYIPISMCNYNHISVVFLTSFCFTS